MKTQFHNKIFRGFRIATMAAVGDALACDISGQVVFRQPDAAYGALHDCILSLTGDTIDWILPSNQLPPLPEDCEVIEGHGRWMTPGLIDCHTHFIYGGNRADEWEARLRGATYQEIARAGGGILSTVRATRSSSHEELVASAKNRLQQLIREGVTTVEIKSGYGLDLDSELKMLKVARTLAEELDLHIEATLLAAHAVPPEYSGRPDDYIHLVCNEILPAARSLCTAVDVFCENIAFSVSQSRRVLTAAIDLGLKIKAHTEQLSRSGFAAQASQLGALSVDHVEYLNPADCSVLANYGTVATLLPGAFYFLRETQAPPISELRRANVAMAVATDANPGSSPVHSLLMAGNMACTLFGLTPEESLTGMTRNAARALGLDRILGTLQPGKRADLAVWDVSSPAEIVYALGQSQCVASYRNGRLRNA